MTHTTCHDCNSKNLRTFSRFNKETDEWEWWKGCNNCTWENRDENEKRKEKINRKEINIKQ